MGAGATEVQLALQASPLRAASRQAQLRLLSSGRELRLEPGAALRRGEVHLLVTGRLALYHDDPDAHSIVLGYLDAGSLPGVAGFLGARLQPRLCAVSPTLTLRLAEELLATILKTEPQVTLAVAQECAHLTDVVLEHSHGAIFADLRQRLAHHLLALSIQGSQPVHVEDLARAVGVWRETVSRHISRLRGLQIVEATPAGLQVLDVDRLAATGWPSATEGVGLTRDRDHAPPVIRTTGRP